jgi:putative transposase
MVLSYKSAVTKYANRLGFPNGWQKLFHERMNRNDEEFQRITNYIIANPQKWDENSK